MAPTEWFATNRPLLSGIALGYLPCVYLLRQWMTHRPPVRSGLALWNLLLWTLNTYCMWHLWNIVVTNGRANHLFDLCENAPTIPLNAGVPNRLEALALFCGLKIVELGDTFWLILRKRPLSVLHVWHHWSVYVYCWWIMASWHEGRGVAEGAYFGAINAFIHCLMYGYYVLTSVTNYRNVRVAHVLTCVQLLQFVVGIALQAYISTCPRKTWMDLWMGWTVYVSYLVLFGNYYVQRYRIKTA